MSFAETPPTRRSNERLAPCRYFPLRSRCGGTTASARSSGRIDHRADGRRLIRNIDYIMKGFRQNDLVHFERKLIDNFVGQIVKAIFLHDFQKSVFALLVDFVRPPRFFRPYPGAENPACLCGKDMNVPSRRSKSRPESLNLCPSSKSSGPHPQ
jgi:hypothetical protein